MASIKIAVISAKGGSFKSTTTMLLAAALGREGLKCAVHDTDPQGTVTAWLSSFDIENVELFRKGQKYDYEFADTPPRVKPSKEMKNMVKGSHINLLMCSDSPLNVHATRLTVENMINTPAIKKKSFVVFSGVAKGTKLGRLEALDRIADSVGIPRLGNPIHFRNCYRQFALRGWKALTPDAKQEVNGLALALGAQLNKLLS